MKRTTYLFVLVSFILNCVIPPQGFAQLASPTGGTLSALGMMPAPGSQAAVSATFTPAYLKGMVINVNDPFRFDFIVHRGDKTLTDEEKQAEYTRLVKYFLAALAVPDADQWVNLSPYEQNRIVPENFGQTEMGRDLLAQDYLLKQLSASLTNPESDLGRKFWDRVYEEAYRRFGTTEVPTDILNKVWILPDKAVVFEKDNTVYVLESHFHAVAEYKSSDLLDAKSNELAIIEFNVEKMCYGINVAKVREIIRSDIDIVPLLDIHPSIKYAINLRGAIIPVVDLARHLKMEMHADLKHNRIIIAEFNRIVLGFLVSSVSRIHRIPWKSVEAPSAMLQAEASYASGMIRIDNRVIFLLDFESIASHINPKANIQEARGGEYGASAIDRSLKNILVVDDSDFTRKLIVGHLEVAGYRTETAINGEEAWKKLAAIKGQPGFEDISRFYNLMVTDIEMPQMDGLSLIRMVKAEAGLRLLPCIAFSSIISKDVIVQCKKAGADAEISKPEIARLVELVDDKAL